MFSQGKQQLENVSIIIPPLQNEVLGGYIGFTLSVRPSVRLSVDKIVSSP